MNTSLFIPKAIYFGYFAALCALVPYLPIYYEQSGLSGTQMGILVSLPPLFVLVFAPLWSALADISRRHRHVLLLGLAGVTAASIGLLLSASFPAMLAWVGVFACFNSTIIPLLDSTTMELLGENRAQYGRQRVWGTIGWGVISPLVGWLMQLSDIRIGFSIFAGFMVLNFCFALRLPDAHRTGTMRWGDALHLVRRNRAWHTFIAVGFFAGIGLASAHMYVLLYMETLQISRVFMGWAMTSATAAEFPVMLWGAWLLRRIGARRLMMIGLAALVIRSFAYPAVQSGWAIILVQLLHGPTFGFLWIAGVAHAHHLSPPGMSATGQGIFSGCCMGLGVAIGALLGGMLIDWFDIQMMFIVSGVIVGLGLLLSIRLRHSW